jgi:hypothetical protein
MILIPLVLNAIQFWIVDNILKLKDYEIDNKIKEIYEQEENPNIGNINYNPPDQSPAKEDFEHHSEERNNPDPEAKITNNNHIKDISINKTNDDEAHEERSINSSKK